MKQAFFKEMSIPLVKRTTEKHKQERRKVFAASRQAEIKRNRLLEAEDQREE